MPIFYLETSALRRLASYLLDTSYTKDAFTSCLAVFELLSGIDENNYSARRNILTKINQSDLRIDWDMPPEKVCFAFIPMQSGGFYADEIKTILQAVIENETLEQADQASKKSGFGVTISGLQLMDDGLSEDHIQGYGDGIRRFRSDWSYKTADVLYRFTHGDLRDSSDLAKELKKTFRETRTSAALTALCYGIAVRFFPEMIREKTLEFYHSYDGSLEYYLEATSYYQENRLVYSKLPARNDFLDLEHFIYLGCSKSVRMVSNDKLIISICHALWPRIGCSSDSFIARCKDSG